MDVFECPFSVHTRHTPQAPALQQGKQVWSYKKCHEWIHGLTGALQKFGVCAHKPVAIYPDGSFFTPLLFFALFRLEAIVFPLHDRLPFAVIKKQLAFAQPTLLLYPDHLKTARTLAKTLSFAQLQREAKPTSCSAARVFLAKTQRATYLATSGTTTVPKIAVHSLGNHYYSALGSNRALPPLSCGLWFLSLPLYHIAGVAILFRTFLAGGAVVFPSARRFDLTDFYAAKVTHLSLVPTQLKRILDAPLEKQRELRDNARCLLLGGSMIPRALYERGLEHGYPLYPTYGMTEMSSQVTTATKRDGAFFSLGHPLPYRECFATSQGEIKVKGKTLFEGYLQETGDVTCPLDTEGYFITQDLGRYSSRRGLTLLGRKDRLFISGGENIHPEEIERALISIEGIVAARVFPKEDAEFGMRPVAHIQSAYPVSEKALQEALASFLPKYKIPVHISLEIL